MQPSDSNGANETTTMNSKPTRNQFQQREFV